MNKPRQNIPVIRILGICCACAFTLIGVLNGVSPEVILLRTGVGTLLVMTVAWCALRAIVAMGA